MFLRFLRHVELPGQKREKMLQAQFRALWVPKARRDYWWPFLYESSSWRHRSSIGRKDVVGELHLRMVMLSLSVSSQGWLDGEYSEWLEMTEG